MSTHALRSLFVGLLVGVATVWSLPAPAGPGTDVAQIAQQLTLDPAPAFSLSAAPFAQAVAQAQPDANDAGPSASPDWATDRLIVQPNAGVSRHTLGQVFSQNGATMVDSIPQINTIVLNVPPDRLEVVERALARSGHFKSVEHDYLRYLQSSVTPNDYWYPAQWHLPKIHAPEAWTLTVGDPSVVIAVIDSGVSAVPDLVPQLLPGLNLVQGGSDTTDTLNHGTGVAGIAAAASNNAVGITGITWFSPILPIKVSTDGSIPCSAISQGIVSAADHGARVINMSFGGSSACSGEQTAVDYAWSKGAVLVAAAGNSSSSSPFYPAAYSKVIGVAALNIDDTLASFSNYGSWLSVSCPGVNLYTTYKSGAYAGGSGTSIAAPVVSGVAALAMAANPALTNSDVKSIIESSADDLGAPGFDPTYGWGRVNAYKAVLAALGASPPPATMPPSASITSPSAGATVTGTTTVSVSASDNVGVTMVGLYLDGRNTPSN
jgi:thermitase